MSTLSTEYFWDPEYFWDFNVCNMCQNCKKGKKCKDCTLAHLLYTHIFGIFYLREQDWLAINTPAPSHTVGTFSIVGPVLGDLCGIVKTKYSKEQSWWWSWWSWWSWWWLMMVWLTRQGGRRGQMEPCWSGNVVQSFSGSSCRRPAWQKYLSDIKTPWQKL